MDSSRISLRPFKLSDADDFLKWASDDRVTRYLRWNTITSAEEASTYIEKVAIPHPWRQSICLDDHCIGYVSVKPEQGDDSCRAHVSYALSADFWGQGIVTSALKMAVSNIFKEFPFLVRIEALVEVENKGSQKVLEKVGFMKEGLLRKYGYCKGEIRDMIMYSLVSTDEIKWDKSGKQEKGTANWNGHNVEILCDLCIKKIEIGHRPGTHLTTIGYDNVGVNFAKATGLQYTRQQFKNKWDSLKKDRKLCKDLLKKETGLGWNPKLKTIDATAEWCLGKIHDKSELAKFGKNGISPKLKQKLDMMFQEVTASGDHAWAPSSGILPPDDIKEDDNVAVSIESDDDLDRIDVIASSLGKRERTPTNEVNANAERYRKGKGIGSRKLGGAVKLGQQVDRINGGSNGK